MLEFDIIGLFDNIDHELLMKAVKKHTDCKWIIIYIERWLKAPFQMKDGDIMERTAGTPKAESSVQFLQIYSSIMLLINGWKIIILKPLGTLCG